MVLVEDVTDSSASSPGSNDQGSTRSNTSQSQPESTPNTGSSDLVVKKYI